MTRPKNEEHNDDRVEKAIFLCVRKSHSTIPYHTPDCKDAHCMQYFRGHSLSLVGRGFFSFVSVFFSLVLSNLAISVRSGLSDIFAVNRDDRFH